MPVTAKLSRNFYNKFGDEIADELVNWFNMIDSTYRADLHELNDRNFERFEFRLAKALAEQGASIRTEMAGQGASLRAEMAEHVATLRVEISQVSSTLRSEMAGMEERLGQRISSLEVRTARETVIQTRWIIGLGAAQMTAFIGTIFIVLQR